LANGEKYSRSIFLNYIAWRTDTLLAAS